MSTLSPFLAALAGQRSERLPVWFMRQAGRSLPEYRQARAGTSMLEACLTPDLAAEITCQPVRRHGVDAAIFFSDIMVPLYAAGVDVEIRPGVGPLIHHPPTSAAEIAQLAQRVDMDTTAISAAARTAVDNLPDTPLIAFAGAPFTVAAYVAEGRGTRDHLAARRLMHTDRHAWDMLMTWVADLAITFIRAQIAGGAQAAQLFDSWAGSLSRADYETYCAPYSARIIRAIEADGIPTIHFGVGTAHLLDVMDACGASCIGVDYRTSLAGAIDLVATTRADARPVVVQGNLDPARLACPAAIRHEHAARVVAEGAAAAAHIVNLGHGVPPDTPPEAITDMVAYIHSLPSGRSA